MTANQQYEVYDTNDDEVVYEGTKQQILDWLWEQYTTNGYNGIEINNK